MSRDVGDPEDFKTKEEAEGRLKELSQFYRSIGYKIWWSNIKDTKEGGDLENAK